MSAHSGLDDAAWGSPWRQVRVGEKVLISLALILTALVLPAWPAGLLVVVLSTALLLVSARVRPRLLLGMSLIPLMFILTSAITAALSFGAPAPDVVWAWGWVSVAPGALERSAGLLIHSVAGTLSVFVLAMTTPMVDLLGWLRRLRVPDPALEIAELTYRMIFGAWASLVAVHAAQVARLGDIGGPARRLQRSAQGLGSVAVRTWLRAERLSDGLTGRGYAGVLPTLPRRATRRVWPVAVAGMAIVWAVGLVA